MSDAGGIPGRKLEHLEGEEAARRGGRVLAMTSTAAGYLIDMAPVQRAADAALWDDVRSVDHLAVLGWWARRHGWGEGDRPSRFDYWNAHEGLVQYRALHGEMPDLSS